MRRNFGWSLVGASLLLHLFTVFCFTWQPDHFAAFTVLPIWLWGALGLLLSTIAWFMLRVSGPWIMTAIWVVTLVVGSDEARALTHFGKSAPLPGPAAPSDGKPVIRVITLNCALFRFGDPSLDLAAWAPDIVLLQDASPHQVRQLAMALYGDRGDFRTHTTNGILTRWKIQRKASNLTQRNQQATITLPDGSAVEVVNVHLASAATDLRFWQRSSWREHRINRALRLDELSLVQRILGQTTDFPNIPTLFGGDFNSPATDVVLRQLTRDFIDAFAAAGSAWGDTYHRRFPILRIDHLYATRHFTPVRCRAFTTRHSDHRLVIADFLLKDGRSPA
jgi:endonuclease/exonuclease/phosphatase (EEP) superfamily protein YafD